MTAYSIRMIQAYDPQWKKGGQLEVALYAVGGQVGVALLYSSL